ncbi:MAG: hypothetical protein LLG04_12100 [Parachlamydia sp.]|nr:hypothetical protein [Parachlamydia sp.]
MFSRKTIIEIVNALNFQTHDEVERFGIIFNLETTISGLYVKQKETSIVKYLISNPEAVGPNGSKMVIEVIEYALKNHKGFDSFLESHPELVHTLDKDGFELTENGLRRNLPAEFPIVEQEDQLIYLLDKFGFATAKGHYEQAVAAHARGEWAAANAQLRTFVEDFFNKTQTIVCPGQYSTSNERKNALANAGFFIKDYNEYLFNGKGFVEGFWKRLHPEGSHPGLSEKSDSTFRLHLVILVIHHFLMRLELNYGKA